MFLVVNSNGFFDHRCACVRACVACVISGIGYMARTRACVRAGCVGDSTGASRIRK